jgi:hypothetical protein
MPSTRFNISTLASVFQAVAQKSEKIQEDEVRCKHMADLAEQDLNEALPALQEAMKVCVRQHR